MLTQYSKLDFEIVELKENEEKKLVTDFGITDY